MLQKICSAPIERVVFALVESNPSVPPQTNLANEQKCAVFDENEYFTTEMIKIHTYQWQDVLEQIKGISHGEQQVSEELTALRHPTIHWQKPPSKEKRALKADPQSEIFLLMKQFCLNNSKNSGMMSRSFIHPASLQGFTRKSKVCFTLSIFYFMLSIFSTQELFLV